MKMEITRYGKTETYAIGNGKEIRELYNQLTRRFINPNHNTESVPRFMNSKTYALNHKTWEILNAEDIALMLRLHDVKVLK